MQGGTGPCRSTARQRGIRCGGRLCRSPAQPTRPTMLSLCSAEKCAQNIFFLWLKILVYEFVYNLKLYMLTKGCICMKQNIYLNSNFR